MQNNINILPLEPDALAALQLRTGSVEGVAECKDILTQYSYIESIDDPQRFDLMSGDTKDEGAALIFSEDFEQVTVFGDMASDNVLNLNYILLKMGWIEADAITHDRDTADFLISQLSNISVFIDASDDNNTGHASPSVEPEELTSGGTGSPVDLESADMLSAISDSQHDLTEKTIELHDAEMRLADVESAHEKTLAQLEERQEQLARAHQTIEDLQRSVASLQRALSQAGAGAPSSSSSDLIQILEDHLSASVNLADSAESALLRLLKTNGYAVKVRLVKETEAV